MSGTLCMWIILPLTLSWTTLFRKSQLQRSEHGHQYKSLLAARPPHKGTTRVCVMRRLRPVEGERGRARTMGEWTDGRGDRERSRAGRRRTSEGGQTERQSYAMLNGKWMRRRQRRRRRRRPREGGREGEVACLRLLDGSRGRQKQKAIRGNEVWEPTTT